MRKKSKHSLRKMNFYRRNEMMAMYQWMEANDPDFQEALKSEQLPSAKPRLISRNSHRKKMPRCNREHY